jgi:hypothetical protein
MAQARTGSKREAAERIYTEMSLTKKGAPRKNAPAPAAVKERFVSEVGMTIAQAATYYHMIASGKWER